MITGKYIVHLSFIKKNLIDKLLFNRDINRKTSKPTHERGISRW